jgi:hypothetical protein
MLMLCRTDAAAAGERKRREVILGYKRGRLRELLSLGWSSAGERWWNANIHLSSELWKEFFFF